MRWNTAALVLVASCSHQDSPTVCTDLFAYVSVAVRDSTSKLVTGLSITDTVVRTREGFAVSQIGLPTSGSYVVFSDNYSSKIRTSGDSVRVTGLTGDGAVKFTSMFVFAVPEGCHVQKVSGPDTVIVAP